MVTPSAPNARMAASELFVCASKTRAMAVRFQSLEGDNSAIWFSIIVRSQKRAAVRLMRPKIGGALRRGRAGDYSRTAKAARLSNDGAGEPRQLLISTGKALNLAKRIVVMFLRRFDWQTRCHGLKSLILLTC